MFFGTTKLGEKRVSHGVGKKCQPVDGFRALKNIGPTYPWAEIIPSNLYFFLKNDIRAF